MAQSQMTAWLEGISGEYHGQSISLAQGATLLGRSRACQIQMHERRISRRHVLIRYAQGRYYAQDQGSQLGTLVNNQRVQAVALNDGDVLSIGQTSFRFRTGVRAQPVAAGYQAAQVPAQPMGYSAAGGSSQPGAIGARDLEDAALRAAALSKSYVGSALLTWFLYWLLYVPGLVVNIVYLSEANRIKKSSGISPSGVGCLQALIWVYFIIPLILLVVFFVFGRTNIIEEILSSFF